MSDKNFIMKPKVDFCFKELLEDSKVRQGFIAALLGVPPEQILETVLLNTHLRRTHAQDKLGILDVRVMLMDATQIDIEMQVTAYDYWTERSVFYLSKMYTDQIHEGEDYGELKKCIHVGILDFILFDDEEYYSRFHIWEDNRKIQYSDKFEIHVLELPKLKKYEYPQTELLKWARFFNAESREELEMIAKENNYIEKALERLKNMSEDEQKRLEYEERQKAIRDYNHMINSGFRQGLRQGHAKGLEDGLAEGREEGLAEGQIKGRIESFQEMGVSKDKTEISLIEKFSISPEEAKEYIDKYWG